MNLIGIVIPLEEESCFLQKNITQPKKITLAGMKYLLGKVANRDIVFVNSGLGKVSSAAITTRLIRDFQPDLILLAGSAGSLNPMVKRGDVVMGKTVIDADFGKLTAHGVAFPYSQYLTNPQTDEVLPLAFSLDNALVKLVEHINQVNSEKIILGKIATSDALPNQAAQIALLQEAKIDVVDMEGASVMQVCWLFNTRCAVIRGVSNHSADPITLSDVQFAADNASRVLMEMISRY